MGNGNRLRVKQPCAAHVQEAFVDGELLHHRGIAAADIHKGFGIALVEPEIRLGQHQRGAFPQGHGNGFSRAHAVVFGGDGLGENHAGSFFRISANGGGDEAKIGFPLGHPPGGLPGKKRAVHINVENKPLHDCSPLCRQLFP